MTSSPTIVITPTIRVAVSAVTSRRSWRRRGGSGKSSSPGVFSAHVRAFFASFASRWGRRPASALIRRLAAAVPEALGAQPLAAAGADRSRARWPPPTARALDDPRLQLAPGTEVVLTPARAAPIDAAPEAIPLDIVYEDADLIVIDKPAGLVVHPAPGAPDGHAGQRAPAPLRRARSRGSAGGSGPGSSTASTRTPPGSWSSPSPTPPTGAWRAQFAAHDLERRYLAVAHGAPDPAEPRLAHLRGISWEPGGVLRIEGGIGRHPGDRKRMAVLSASGKPAVTRARRARAVRPRRPAAALVECRLETGRTHQIRVHMAFAGHPLVGDAVYGRRRGAGPARRLPAPGAARGEPRLRPSGDRRGDALRVAAAGRHGRRCSPRLRRSNEAGDVQRSVERPIIAGERIGGARRRPARRMSLAYERLPAPSPEQGLSRYMQEIRRFPMLEPEEEYMLAKAWVDHGDKEAAHRLVTSHLRLAAKIAMGYRGYGLPTAEVISEANVGLMQAVKRFDPEKGFRLATYAMWWIRASIQEYILRSWSLVKMGTTAAQKKLFFNLRKAKNKIGAIEEGELRPENVAKIAHDLNVTEQRGDLDEPPDGRRRRQPQRPGARRRRRHGRVAGLARGRGRRPGDGARRARRAREPAASCCSRRWRR